MHKINDLVILGATGSIGTNALKICKSNNIDVKAITINKNANKAIEIIKTFNISYIGVLDDDAYKTVSDYITSNNLNIKCDKGLNGLIKAIDYSHNILNAISTISGLRLTIEAIRPNNILFLANKESICTAGDIIKKLALKENVQIIPIDSEHNAIYRLLNDKSYDAKKKLDKIILTASGGPFVNYTKEMLEHVTVENALAHPNWSMGNKITIDSSTLVNKGLEVIEAHYLFDVDYDKIEAIIHKESIIHSMVAYIDGSVEALMYTPTMLNPIANSLLFSVSNVDIEKLDFTKINSLTFKKIDDKVFPLYPLAIKCGKLGNFYPALFTCVNDICVELFLKGKIKYLDIERIITKEVNNFENESICKLEYNIDNIFKLFEYYNMKYKEVFK